MVPVGFRLVDLTFDPKAISEEQTADAHHGRRKCKVGIAGPVKVKGRCEKDDRDDPE